MKTCGLLLDPRSFLTLARRILVLLSQLCPRWCTALPPRHYNVAGANVLVTHFKGPKYNVVYTLLLPQRSRESTYTSSVTGQSILLCRFEMRNHSLVGYTKLQTFSMFSPTLSLFFLPLFFFDILLASADSSYNWKKPMDLFLPDPNLFCSLSIPTSRLLIYCFN